MASLASPARTTGTACRAASGRLSRHAAPRRVVPATSWMHGRPPVQAPRAVSRVVVSRGCRGLSVLAAGDVPPPPPPPRGPPDYVRAIVENVGRTAGHAPVIFLKMLDGSDRVLPVFIGEAECAALLKEIRNQPSLRPMTHDLMKSSLQAVGVTVTRVQVTEMRDNTFFARIFYAGPTGEVTDVDARPSDAINLAVRFGAPIYVAKQVVTGSAYLMNGTDYTPLADGTLPLSALGVAGGPPPTDELVQAVQRQVVRRRDPALELRSRLAMAVAEEQYDDAATLVHMIASVIGSHTIAKLLHQMETAVAEERYRDAAKLRDELNRLDAESAERDKIIFEEHSE